MKARHKKTGREIAILGISKEWGTVTFIAEGLLHQENLASGEWEIIDESEPTDWSSFRREAAKDILGAVIAKKNSMCSYAEVVKEAIKFADELIKQIQEK